MCSSPSNALFCSSIIQFNAWDKHSPFWVVRQFLQFLARKKEALAKVVKTLMSCQKTFEKLTFVSRLNLFSYVLILLFFLF